jgi:ribosome biogenesis protein SSF1/2
MQKKARSQNVAEDELVKELPRIFVVRKGDISSEMTEMIHDLRECFYPNTAMKLEDNNRIDMKTYLKTAKYYNVTHLVALQMSGLSTKSIMKEII